MARRGTAALNPFDSDEEEEQQHRQQAPCYNQKSETCSNPFDDDANFARVSGSARKPPPPPAAYPRNTRNPERVNPFSSDDDDKADEKDRVRSYSSRRRGSSAPPPPSYHGNYSGVDVEAENGNPSHSREDDAWASSRGKRRERFLSHVKGFSASVGESAVKTAEKLKESTHRIGIKRHPESRQGISQHLHSSHETSAATVNSNTISSERRAVSTDERANLFAVASSDEILENRNRASSMAVSSSTRRQYRNDFRDSGGFENQSVQELQGYAVYKAEETTKATRHCLEIAENIKDDASRTLVTLHHQGDQITKTHNVAVDIDHDLSRGEKLLGSLGGMFSRTWKPEKGGPINGPVITSDTPFQRRAKHMEQRNELGLNKNINERASNRSHQAADTFESQIEVEKAKQDDALSDLSNVLDQLKDMAIDMGGEIERQNVALDHLGDDVTELSHRVKGANMRGRRLLGK